MFVHHVPVIVQKVFPEYIWHKDRESKEIFITFDDGPVPGVTEKVLKILNDFNCYATFFMVGHNVTKYSSLAKEVLAAGHQIGNHTYHHLRGYQCSTVEYLADIMRCQSTLIEVLDIDAKYFRPPYGRITSDQAKGISNTHKVVMWDVLSGDYDADLSSDRILKKTKKHTQNGSIIVFHDQIKTAKRLPDILIEFLNYSSGQGLLPVAL